MCVHLCVWGPAYLDQRWVWQKETDRTYIRSTLSVSGSGRDARWLTVLTPLHTLPAQRCGCQVVTVTSAVPLKHPKGDRCPPHPSQGGVARLTFLRARLRLLLLSPASDINVNVFSKRLFVWRNRGRLDVFKFAVGAPWEFQGASSDSLHECKITLSRSLFIPPFHSLISKALYRILDVKNKQTNKLVLSVTVMLHLSFIKIFFFFFITTGCLVSLSKRRQITRTCEKLEEVILVSESAGWIIRKNKCIILYI